MMFSSQIDIIYKNSALQDIFVKLLFIEYMLSKKYPLDKKVMSDYISTNSGIHHRFRMRLRAAWYFFEPRRGREKIRAMGEMSARIIC